MAVDRDRECTEYVTAVERYFTERGWQLDRTQVAETVWLYGGTKPSSDGETSHAVIIVAAGADDSLTRQHLDYLARAADKYGTDTAFAHARLGTTDETARLCEEHGIQVVDPAEIGPKQDPVDGIEFPSQAEQSISEEQTTQPRRPGQSAEAVTAARQVSPAPTAVARRNLVRGGLHGASAWLVGYCLVFLFSLADNYQITSDFHNPISAPGWAFYGAHRVTITRTVTRDSGTQTQQVEVFGTTPVFEGLTSTVPAVVYQLAPVVILLGAGYLVVKNADETGLSTAATATLGGTICVGYLLVMVAARPVFEATASSAELSRLPGGSSGIQQITAVPELTGTVFQAGVIYPLVFGAIGALLASYRDPGEGR